MMDLVKSRITVTGPVKEVIYGNMYWVTLWSIVVVDCSSCVFIANFVHQRHSLTLIVIFETRPEN